MISADELASAAEALPLELKTELIERLLNSLNSQQKDIDKLWSKEVERRVEELKNGKVIPIPGEKVFRDIRDKLTK